MPGVNNPPPLQPSDVMALIASSASISYVGGSNTSPLTLDDLLTKYPASVQYLGQYARVSNLYSSIDDVMRCRYDGTNYRWVPQREAFAGNDPTTSGSVSLIPLFTPPTLRMVAPALVGNVTVSAASINAYVGQRFRVIVPSNMNLGVLTMQITGLIGSNITLLAGNTRDIEYGSTGWFQST